MDGMAAAPPAELQDLPALAATATRIRPADADVARATQHTQQHLQGLEDTAAKLPPARFPGHQSAPPLRAWGSAMCEANAGRAYLH